MKIRFILLLLVAQGITIEILANVNIKKNLSLEEVVSASLERSELVAQKKNESIKKEHQYDEAWGSVYPQINGEISWNYYFKVPQSTMNLPGLPPIKMNMKDKYENSLSVTATQVLWSFGRVRTAIDIANKTLENSKFDLNLARNMTIYQAKMAYYSVLLTKHSYQTALDSYENAKNNKDLLRKRFSYGRPPRRDLLRISADIASRLPTLKNAESELILAKRRLKSMLDISEEVEIVLTDVFSESFRELDLDTFESKLTKNSSELKMLRQKASIDEDMLKIRKASFLPTLSMFGTYSLSRGSEEKVLGTGNDFTKTGVIGLQLSIPIWNGGQKIHQFREAIVDKTNTLIEIRKVDKSLRLLLRNSVSSYLSLLETYKANMEAVRLAEESYSLKKIRFASGKVSITELNDVELLLTSQKLNSKLTLFKIHITDALIEKLIAKGSSL